MIFNKIKAVLTVVAAAAALLSAECVSAAEKAIGVSKNVAVERRAISTDYTEVEVSRAVHLTIEERTDGVAVVRANENVLPYIYVQVADGKLKAGISGDLSITSSSGRLVVEISVPYSGHIESVELSGASSVVARPLLKSERFSAGISGASHLKADIESAKCEIEASGASSVQCGVTGGTLGLEVGGASSFKGALNVIKSEIEVSGGSRATLSGSSSSAEIEVSGAASLQASDLGTEVCSIDSSGASSAEIQCSKSLSARASGASSIRYSGECRVAVSSTSGMGKISKR